MHIGVHIYYQSGPVERLPGGLVLVLGCHRIIYLSCAGVAPLLPRGVKNLATGPTCITGFDLA